jgi:hypothetical protein
MESKANHRGGALAMLLLLGTLGVSTATVAGVQELVRDTQRSAESAGQITTVWWMPQQFWDESLKANPAVPAEARQQVLSSLEGYTIIAMLRARVGAAGLEEVQPKAELLKNVVVESNGKVVEPVAPDQISPVAQVLLLQLKPAMAAMMGQAGQALEFVVYPSKSADGKPLMDAAQSGSMTIKLYDQTFSWRLPLGSLMPARIDKKTGEEFPGNYQFNPYTGDKLGTR